MARARNIKPGLFSNELLAELPAFDRLLFIGMWCLADREGRLEDRPKRIKMELFPCDDYDVDAGLSRLAGTGFVSRYQVEGFSVIEIDNFQKHQNPHGSEKDSVLPDKDGYLTVNERKKNVVLPGKQRRVHVKAQEFNVNPPLEPVNPTTNNALIPDSPNPDSLIPEEDQHNTQRAGEEFGVDPKQPTEMDLGWKPDEKLLKAYAKRIGIPVDLFTDEATATFVCHYSASGRFETQAAWVSLLVKWVKRDVATASNVRPFPLKRQVNGPDFNDTTWSDDLGAM
ncbi:hypothetical protein D3C77_129980 [compost metagenome]